MIARTGDHGGDVSGGASCGSDHRDQADNDALHCKCCVEQIVEMRWAAGRSACRVGQGKDMTSTALLPPLNPVRAAVAFHIGG